MLLASGLNADHAGIVSDVFMRASQRQMGHHDLSYLPQRLLWLHEAGVKAKAQPFRVSEGPAFEVWDGDAGLGELACATICKQAIERAKTSGVAFASVRHSNHFLAASPYTDMGLEAGCLLLVWSNTDAGMSGPGTGKNIIGNNPVGFAIEVAQAAPLSVDTCLAYSSLGNLRDLALNASEVPSYWGNDKSGKPSSKASELLDGGAVHPIGGHKGFGLALLHEVLTGILSGGTTLDQVASGGGINTHNQSVLVFDLEFFGGRQEVAQRTADMLSRLLQVEEGLRLPGQHSHQARLQSLKEGIELSPSTLEQLRWWSHKLDVQAAY